MFALLLWVKFLVVNDSCQFRKKLTPKNTTLAQQFGKILLSLFKSFKKSKYNFQELYRKICQEKKYYQQITTNHMTAMVFILNITLWLQAIDMRRE